MPLSIETVPTNIQLIFSAIKAKITKIFRTMYPKEWQYLKDYEWEGKDDDMRCLRDRVYEVEIQQVFKVIYLKHSGSISRNARVACET